MTGVNIPDARAGRVWIHGVDATGLPVLVTVDASGHLQVDALTSALPTGAATAANQTTEITALQLIDDLRDVLASVAADSLILYGLSSFENVPWGYNARFSEAGSDLAAAAGTNSKDSAVVPAGEVWVVTAMWSRNDTTSVRQYHSPSLGGMFHRANDIAAPGVGITRTTVGQWVLAAGDFLRWSWLACVVGDDIFWGASGYKMKIA